MKDLPNSSRKELMKFFPTSIRNFLTFQERFPLTLIEWMWIRKRVLKLRSKQSYCKDMSKIWKMMRLPRLFKITPSQLNLRNGFNKQKISKSLNSKVNNQLMIQVELYQKKSKSLRMRMRIQILLGKKFLIRYIKPQSWSRLIKKKRKPYMISWEIEETLRLEKRKNWDWRDRDRMISSKESKNRKDPSKASIKRIIMRCSELKGKCIKAL